MKRRRLILTALALIMILGAGIGTAHAYFSTYARAVGGYPIYLGAQTEITETLSSWTKHVSMTGQKGSEPVYVRVRAFCGAQYTLSFSDSADVWSPGSDGWYYCAEPLYAEQSTPELLIYIDGVPQSAVDGNEFNVVVVYETTPVQYTPTGEPYADWNIVLDSGKGGTDP